MEKMDYRLEFMVLLVFLTTVSSVVLSRDEFAEAVVRNADENKNSDQFSSISWKQNFKSFFCFNIGLQTKYVSFFYSECWNTLSSLENLINP